MRLVITDGGKEGMGSVNGVFYVLKVDQTSPTAVRGNNRFQPVSMLDSASATCRRIGPDAATWRVLGNDAFKGCSQR